MDAEQPDEDHSLPHRAVNLTRATRETVVSVYLDIDGTGDSQVFTGFALLDHYLDTLALHGALDLKLKVESPRPDLHHCAEDTGWAIGTALRRCLELRGVDPEKSGGADLSSRYAAQELPFSAIRRFGWSVIPFDEVLVLVALDLVGRPGFCLSPEDGLGYGDFQEFFKAFTGGASATLHMQILRDGNPHHKIECFFKGLGRALRDAVEPDYRVKQTSVKGAVEYRTKGIPNEG